MPWLLCVQPVMLNVLPALEARLLVFRAHRQETYNLTILANAIQDMLS